MTYIVTVTGTTFDVSMSSLTFPVTLSQVGQQGQAGADGAALVYEGAWSVGAACTEDDLFTNNGSTYACIADHTATANDEPGVGVNEATYWVLFVAKGDNGTDGTDGTDGLGWTGGNYNASTGVVTFTSDDGLEFSTGDLRGADGAGTVTSIDIAGGTGIDSSGGPVTTSGTITVALDSATQTSLGKADTAQQPPSEGAFVDGDKTKLDGIGNYKTTAQTTTDFDALAVSGVYVGFQATGAPVPDQVVVEHTEGTRAYQRAISQRTSATGSIARQWFRYRASAGWDDWQELATVDDITSGQIAIAEGAIVTNTSGDVLYAKSPDVKIAPASLTKVMTVLTAIDRLTTLAVDLDTFAVSVTTADEVGGSGANVSDGDTMLLEAAIANMLLPSSNNTAMALARSVALEANGSDPDPIATFVGWMNDLADDLGMTLTNFTNPTGLANGAQLSTARDMATMLAEANSEIRITDIWGLAAAGVVISGPNARVENVSHSVPIISDSDVLGGKSGTLTPTIYNAGLIIENAGGDPLVVVVLESDATDQRYKDARVIHVAAQSAASDYAREFAFKLRTSLGSGAPTDQRAAEVVANEAENAFYYGKGLDTDGLSALTKNLLFRSDGARLWHDIIGAADGSTEFVGEGIVTTGTNANGTWIRAAGVQICFAEVSLGSIQAFGSGTLANPYRTATFDWTFPIAFGAFPSVVGGWARTTGANAGTRGAHHIGGGIGRTSTQATDIQAYRTSSDSNNDDILGMLVAFGPHA